MKKYILSIISALLFLAATVVSTLLVIELLALPENPTEMGESIGKGLSIAISIIFFAIAAIVQAVAALLALIGLIVSKKTLAPRGVVVLYAVQTALPIVMAALPFLFIPS
ncbi:MAG: hypothetical protein IJF73_06490 [Clostridia bacterium]|nr:hypothetical protein [Clostridia bacterium]